MSLTLRSAQTPLTVVVIVVLVLLPAHTRAQAQDCTNSLVVPSGLMTLGADATYDCVTVAPGAQLWTGNHTLTVTGHGGLTCAGELKVQEFGRLVLTGGGTSVIDGIVILTGSTSAVRVTTNSCTISGSGELSGQVSGASLEIATGKTLTSQTTIGGALLLKPPVGGGSAFFHNDGVVRAELGVVSLHALIVLTDTSNARWEAASGTLQFNARTVGLLGGFGVYNSTLAINSVVSTAGPLDYTVGTIDVAALALFKYGRDNCRSQPPLPNPIIGPASVALNCP